MSNTYLKRVILTNKQATESVYCVVIKQLVSRNFLYANALNFTIIITLNMTKG